MNLFYFTASSKDAQKHLQDTIQNKFRIGQYRFLLPKEVFRQLQVVNAHEEVNMWGALPGPANIRNWNKIEKGDRVLVYSQGKFVYYGMVLEKVHSPEIAEFAWGKDIRGETWEYIYFLYNLQEIDIDVVEFARFFGYKTNFIPQGFSFIREEIVTKCMNEFGGIDQAISFLTNSTLKATMGTFNNIVEQHGERELESSIMEMDDDQFVNYINSLDSNASIEVKEGLRKIRKYNKKIIDELKERYNHRCQICGRSSLNEYGVSVVEGHHIEPFSLTQNNSPNNIMILCPTHHRLIHKAKGEFDRKKKEIHYANGYSEKLLLNEHL